MFCTSLHHRPDLTHLLPFLSSSTNPKLRESNLRTHDLALALPSSRSQGPQLHNYSNNNVNRLFLILTPQSTTPTNLPDTLARVRQFTSLSPPNRATTTTTTQLTIQPRPTIAFLLSPSPLSSSPTPPLHAYTLLQTSIHSLPLFLHPPPLLPIQSPASLLPNLLSYLSQQQPSTQQPPTPISSFLLLRHATTTPLPEHSAHVLSDLYPTFRALVAAVGTQAGRERLREWLGGEEGEGVILFWEGEWVFE